MHFRMDWRAVRFDWNRARAFLVTAEEGSLSAAARALGLTQPTLGRQVGALERELGVILFERVGHRLIPTPAGLDLMEHVRAMGEAAARASLAASGRSQAIEGTIRITASEVYAAWVLPPILADLRREEPGIEVQLVSTNSLSDLRRREADIAVRSGRPADPDLIGRKLRDDEAALYAAVAYLDRAGPFPDAAALGRAEFVGFDDNQGFLEGLNALGLNLSPRQFGAVSTSHLVHWELVRAGAGIGVMVTSVGDGDPAVRRAVPWLEPFRYPLWLAAHRELHTSRRVRLVFDRLSAALAR